MLLAWKDQQQRHRAPKVLLTDDLTKDVLKSKIVEDSDELNEDSIYDLLESQSQSEKQEEQDFDINLDLNERNFNLVKNSNSFKPMSLNKNKKMENEGHDEIIDFNLDDGSFKNKSKNMFGHRISEEDRGSIFNKFS